ncbi:hypothetical protein MHU86_22312 [Fragilaria crotonensis]|nr:hypothetical protein MHU86_22312 [Fragilaria crotonensis]
MRTKQELLPPWMKLLQLNNSQFLPWLRLHPGHQLFHSHCQALHCSPKASNSHDVSNEEQSIDPRSLQSPPTPDIRTSPLQRRPHSSSQAKEETPRKVPATLISPVHQPIFSPVREQTPMSETRESPVPDNAFALDSPRDEQPVKSPPPPTSPRRSNRIRAAPQRLGYDNTKAMDTLLLQVLGSLRKMESSFPQLPSRQLHLILTL